MASKSAKNMQHHKAVKNKTKEATNQNRLTAADAETKLLEAGFQKGTDRFGTTQYVYTSADYAKGGYDWQADTVRNDEGFSVVVKINNSDRYLNAEVKVYEPTSPKKTGASFWKHKEKEKNAEIIKAQNAAMNAKRYTASLQDAEKINKIAVETAIKEIQRMSNNKVKHRVPDTTSKAQNYKPDPNEKFYTITHLN